MMMMTVLNQKVAALFKLPPGRMLTYLTGYPFARLGKQTPRVHAIHSELRWIRAAIGYLKLLGESQLPDMDPQFLQEVRNYYHPVGHYIHPDDYRIFFHLTGQKNKKFISNYLFHNHVMSVLNPAGLESNLMDKNVYSRIYSEFRQPETLLRYMRGAFYNAKYRMISSAEAERVLLNAEIEWVIKPSRFSNSGTGVFTGSSSGGKIVMNGAERSLGYFRNNYPEGFIIQERVKQSEHLSVFHPGSLNTLRVFTLRLGSEIVTLPGTYARFGRGGNHVDNMGSGGVGCGVSAGGELTPRGISNDLKWVERHPDTGIVFSGRKLPFYAEVMSFVTEMHRVTPKIGLASWDIAIDEKDEPVLIEINTFYPSSFTPQLLNGPFFGEYTDAVLDHTIRKKTPLSGAPPEGSYS